MKSPLWVIELADEFWQAAGMVEPFPRNLRQPITRAVEGMVAFLPKMCLESVKTRLREMGIPCPCDQADRPLRACLVARLGWAIILIDGSDAEDEQRFSLAHELSHFLRDYWQPRRLASQRLGEQVLAVFDAQRAPTPQERIQALVAQVPIGYHVHFMERNEDGSIDNRSIAEAEEEADLLAFELLAPIRAIASQARAALNRSSLSKLLQGTYGLPAAQAKAYCRKLLPSPPPRDPVLQRLL